MYSTERDWDILPWGFQTWNSNISGIQKANYLIGGVCGYKRGVLGEFKFKEYKHGGRCANEDVDFFLRASKKFDFYITPFAKAYHKQSSTGRENPFKTGIKASFNRIDTFVECADRSIKNIICFYCAMFGSIIKAFLSTIFAKRERVKHIYETLGMIVGIFRYVTTRR